MNNYTLKTKVSAIGSNLPEVPVIYHGFTGILDSTGISLQCGWKYSRFAGKTCRWVGKNVTE